MDLLISLSGVLFVAVVTVDVIEKRRAQPGGKSRA
jgi:hypothetical protein